MKRCIEWNLVAIGCCLFVFSLNADGQNDPAVGPVTPQTGSEARPAPARDLTPEELEELREEESQPNRLNSQKDVIGSGSGIYFSIQCPEEIGWQVPGSTSLAITVNGSLDEKQVRSWTKFAGLTTLYIYFPDDRKEKTTGQPLDLSPLRPMEHLLVLSITPSYWSKKPAVFTDQLDSLVRLSQLSELAISSCVITPQAARNIASIPKLAHLILVDCQFEGDALSEFKSMASLVCLDLRSSSFSDDSLRALEACPKLRHLNIQESKASAKAFTPCKGWRALEGLDISGTKIEGDEVLELGKCKNLKVLSAWSLKLTPSQIRGIAKNTPVRQIAVSDKLDWKLLKQDLAKRHIEIIPIEDRKIVEESEPLASSENAEISIPRESILTLSFPNGLDTKKHHRELRSIVDMEGDWKRCGISGLSPISFQAEDFAIFDAVDCLALAFDAVSDESNDSPVVVDPEPANPSGGVPVTPFDENKTQLREKAYAELLTKLSHRPLENSRLKELRIRTFFFEPKVKSFDFLKKFPLLEALSIENAGMEDQFAETLAQLPHLQQLRLESKNITDKAVEKLARSESIEFLDISSTSATDTCIEHLAKFKNLKEVHCYYTTIALEKCKVLEEKGIVVKGGQGGNMMNWEKYTPKHGGMGI